MHNESVNRKSELSYSQQRIINTGHLHACPHRQVGSFNEPHRVVDLKPPAAIHDRAVEGECPAQVGLCTAVEMELARSPSNASKSQPADRQHRYRGVVYRGLPSHASSRGLACDAGNVARFRDPAV